MTTLALRRALTGDGRTLGVAVAIAMIAGTVATGTAFAGPAPAAPPSDLPQLPYVELFREKAGDMEFSGRLIVRPLQDHRTAASPILRGRDTQARARLAGMTAKYYADVDEYVIDVPAGQARGIGENVLAAQLLATGDYEYVVPD
jgi:hypothetical protein